MNAMFSKLHQETVVRKGIGHNLHLAYTCFSESTPIEIALSIFVNTTVALNQRNKSETSLRIVVNRFYFCQ